jgi:predicted enzyme related to lactoylglutathione lyase
VVNEPGAWSMSTLNTPDPAGATAFYRAVFGWEVEPFGEIALWRLPGYVGGTPQQPVPRDVVAVMAGSSGDRRDDQPQWSVDFWVKDADTTAETAAGLGGSVLVPPHDIPGFREAVLADPLGAVFTVSQLTAGS